MLLCVVGCIAVCLLFLVVVCRLLLCVVRGVVVGLDHLAPDPSLPVEETDFGQFHFWPS